MKKKLLIIGSCLIIILAGFAFFKKQQSPKEVEIGNATIGYMGCSNTRQTVFGYHWVGGVDFWSGSEDRLHDYDSGGVLNVTVTFLALLSQEFQATRPVF